MTPVARDPGGRVHLVVQRDPATGADRVALTGPVFEEDWQNDLTTAAANTVHGTFAGAPSLEGAVVIARDSMTATERLIGSARKKRTTNELRMGVLRAHAPAGAVACKAGCDHCCYQSVGVTPPEVLAIFDHLSRTLSDDAMERFAAHVAEARARQAGAPSTTSGRWRAGA